MTPFSSSRPHAVQLLGMLVLARPAQVNRHPSNVRGELAPNGACGGAAVRAAALASLVSAARVVWVRRT